MLTFADVVFVTCQTLLAWLCCIAIVVTVSLLQQREE